MSDVKLNDTHLTIHLALIGHTDAASSDRVDGSSTGGYVLTMAPYKQFIVGHMTDMSLTR